MERIKNLSRALFVALTLCLAVVTSAWSQAPPAPGEGDRCSGQGRLCRDVEYCDYSGGGSTCTTDHFYYP